jgi:hypothetical protein
MKILKINVSKTGARYVFLTDGSVKSKFFQVLNKLKL